MFISTAFAAEGAPAAGGDMSMIIVLTICMVAVYFFVMRPNSKKRKEMQKLLDNLAVGDEVLTNGGIAGRISRLPDNKEYVLIAVGGGIELQMKRNYVVAVLPKGTLEPEVRTTTATAGRRPVKMKKKGAPAAAAPAADKSAEAKPEETKTLEAKPEGDKEAETKTEPAEAPAAEVMKELSSEDAAPAPESKNEAEPAPAETAKAAK